MLIVAGTFTVAPEDRTAFIEGRIDGVLHTRSEKGCLTYSLMADPVDDDTVRIFECWESQEDLDAHLAAVRAARSPQPARQQVPVLGRSLIVYPVAAEGPHPL
jgi:quinol monooxygenase YgiN